MLFDISKDKSRSSAKGEVVCWRDRHIDGLILIPRNYIDRYFTSEAFLRVILIWLQNGL